MFVLRLFHFVLLTGFQINKIHKSISMSLPRPKRIWLFNFIIALRSCLGVIRWILKLSYGERCV